MYSALIQTSAPNLQRFVSQTHLYKTVCSSLSKTVKSVVQCGRSIQTHPHAHSVLRIELARRTEAIYSC